MGNEEIHISFNQKFARVNLDSKSHIDFSIFNKF